MSVSNTPFRLPGQLQPETGSAAHGVVVASPREDADFLDALTALSAASTSLADKGPHDQPIQRLEMLLPITNADTVTGLTPPVEPAPSMLQGETADVVSVGEAPLRTPNLPIQTPADPPSPAPLGQQRNGAMQQLVPPDGSVLLAGAIPLSDQPPAPERRAVVLPDALAGSPPMQATAPKLETPPINTKMPLPAMPQQSPEALGTSDIPPVELAGPSKTASASFAAQQLTTVHPTEVEARGEHLQVATTAPVQTTSPDVIQAAPAPKRAAAKSDDGTQQTVVPILPIPGAPTGPASAAIATQNVIAPLPHDARHLSSPLAIPTGAAQPTARSSTSSAAATPMTERPMRALEEPTSTMTAETAQRAKSLSKAASARDSAPVRVVPQPAPVPTATSLPSAITAPEETMDFGIPSAKPLAASNTTTAAPTPMQVREIGPPDTTPSAPPDEQLARPVPPGPDTTGRIQMPGLGERAEIAAGSPRFAQAGDGNLSQMASAQVSHHVEHTRQSAPNAPIDLFAQYKGADAAERLAAQLTSAVSRQSGEGRITVQLDPIELGRIEIALDITEQGLRATLAAERAVTTDLLRRHGDMLLQELRAAGFASVDLGMGGQDGRNSARHGPIAHAKTNGRGLEGGDTDAGEAPPPPLADHHSMQGLDLRL